jgi:glycosyltransferase involved in cell wall biosynthesis
MNVGHKGDLHVLLVAENISLRQSGETSLAYYYLDRFLKNGVEVQAICHARVRDDLRSDLDPELFARITFIDDTRLQKFIFALGKKFRYRIEDLVFGQILHMLTQVRMRRVAKRLIQAKQIDVVFEPAPISPKAISFMFGVGAPVVIGPMCGGLELPPAFRAMDGSLVTWSIRTARFLADVLHRAIPGKLQAAGLIVGNQRTAAALPHGVRGKVYEVVESGVDLDRWDAKPYPVAPDSGPVRFVFCGRLVDWKGAHYLVKAFVPLARRGGATLDLIGDGPLFEQIRDQIASEGVGHAVTLHGRIPLTKCIEMMTASDVYVMPSLRECGGLALLEAMAIGLPIVATNWMGPAEYLDASCSILVDPSSEQALVDGFTDAMSKLADSRDLRQSLGQGARKRVFSGYFGWHSKVTRVIEILKDVLAKGCGETSAATVGPAPGAEPLKDRSAV